VRTQTTKNINIRILMRLEIQDHIWKIYLASLTHVCMCCRCTFHLIQRAAVHAECIVMHQIIMISRMLQEKSIKCAINEKMAHVILHRNSNQTEEEYCSQSHSQEASVGHRLLDSQAQGRQMRCHHQHRGQDIQKGPAGCQIRIKGFVLYP